MLALVGESGAGKTTLGLALLGFLRPGMHRAAGTVSFRGRSLFDLPGRALRRLRRAERGLAAVLISHDLPAVAGVADDLIVLRDGETVERGGALRVLSEPAAAYSRSLVEAAPDLDREPPRAPLEAGEGRPLLEAALPLSRVLARRRADQRGAGGISEH